MMGLRRLSLAAAHEAGVYELLDQVNLCGTAAGTAEVLGEMIGA